MRRTWSGASIVSADERLERRMSPDGHLEREIRRLRADFHENVQPELKGRQFALTRRQRERWERRRSALRRKQAELKARRRQI